MQTFRRSLAALAILLLASPGHALVIEFDPAADTVNVGDTFEIDIRISGLDAAAEAVTGFDLFMGFDPAILSPASVAFGPGADAIFDTDVAFAFGDTFDLGSGLLLGTTGLSTSNPFSISALGFIPSPQGDSVLLATLMVDALAAGFGNLTLLDPNVTGLDPFAGSLAFDLIGEAAITVEAPVAVSEPGMLLLLGIGLLLSLRLGHTHSR